MLNYVFRSRVRWQFIFKRVYTVVIYAPHNIILLHERGGGGGPPQVPRHATGTGTVTVHHVGTCIIPLTWLQISLRAAAAAVIYYTVRRALYYTRVIFYRRERRVCAGVWVGVRTGRDLIHRSYRSLHRDIPELIGSYRAAHRIYSL